LLNYFKQIVKQSLKEAAMVQRFTNTIGILYPMFLTIKRKNMFRKFLSRSGFITLGSLLAFALLFSACRKNNNDIVQTPVAHLMAFNLVPDQERLGFALSGNILPGGPMAYTSFSGTYLNVFPGNRLIETYNPATNQVVDSLQYTFKQDKYYSVFAVGANGHYRSILAEDNYDSLTASSGKAYVRYINAIPDSAASNVRIAVGGTNVVDKSASFGQVSEFAAVNPGDISVNVNNESTVNASRTLAVQEHKAYTILLIGVPNQTGDKAVQIRFIENGTVTD
jgi:hypothetical protein